MTKEQTAVCSFIKAAHGHDSASLPADLDYGKVFDVACQQGVVCLVFDGLATLINKRGKNGIPQEFILQLYAKKAQTEKTMRDRQSLILEFAERMRPLQGFVLKGLDYALHWPNPLYREYGDFDCYYGSEYSKVNERAAEIGAKVEYSTHKHIHIYYKGLMVENHQTFTDYDGSRIGRQTETQLKALIEERGERRIAECGILSPNPIFTACFMLKHAQQHFMTEGIELRHFLDWMYFVDTEGDKIDWERLDGLLEEMKLCNFAEMMTAYCITRLGWQPKYPIINYKLSIVNSSLLDRVDDFVFSERADVQNKQPIYRAKRILKRFARAWHFRHLHYLPYHKAVWTWIAYASTLDRKP